MLPFPPFFPPFFLSPFFPFPSLLSLFSPLSAPLFLGKCFRRLSLVSQYLGPIWLDQAGQRPGVLLSLSGVQAIAHCKLHRTMESVRHNFINPTISRSEFIATNTIPVSLTTPTFSWHRVWPPVISQQKLASTTWRWSKTAQWATNCWVHPCWNEKHIPKRSKEAKKKKSKNTESLRGESNPLGHHTYIFIFPTMKTRVTSTLEPLTIPILVPCFGMWFSTVSIRLYPHKKSHTWDLKDKSLKSLKFLSATPKEKAACCMFE